MADDFKALIAKVATGASLTRDEAANAFDRMMSGEATPSQMGALLMALRVRGTTADEMFGIISTIRRKMDKTLLEAHTDINYSSNSNFGSLHDSYSSVFYELYEKFKSRNYYAAVKRELKSEPLIERAASHSALTRDEATQAFELMMSGDATPSQMGGLLMTLRVRGETVEEITGAVNIMRAKMLGVKAPADAVDVVGTGGDASGSFNISTCAAFIVAGVGVPVAKHGNRALSSRSGAADVLAALGVKIDINSDRVGRCIAEAGIGFMFAPAHHPAMRNVGPTRVELGFRTIFNLLGPLSNPAGVKRQMIGTFAKRWIEPMAEVLNNLGSERVWVVHGSDGLDEITATGPTSVAALEDGKVRTFEVTPEEAGLPRVKSEALRGGDAVENAKALLGVLRGKKGAYRIVSILNAAATLIIAGRAENLREGAALAAKSIDGGEAEGRLDRLIKVSNVVEVT